MKTFELRLIDEDLHESLRKAAFEAHISMNSFILEAIREKIEREASEK